MIVILNGPLGAGKTETSWRLLQHFEQAILLDGDYLGAVHPFEIYDEARIAYLYRTIAHVVAFHTANGHHNFVINYAFETPQSLAQLRRLLSEYDDEIYAFRLVCAAEALERRVRQRSRGREPDEAGLAWEIHRCHELSAIIETQSAHGDMGFPVDCTVQDAAQTAAAIWQNIREKVAITQPDSLWPQQFAAERQQISALLASWALDIQHVGSTAVPGLPAKPVIDILVAVRQLEDAARCIAPLQTIGYQFVDYPQNSERRFFRKGLPRTHHLHIVAAGSAEHRDHLDFRDALRARYDWRQEYAALKLSLAAQYPHDRARYSAAKTDFVRQVLTAWRRAGG